MTPPTSTLLRGPVVDTVPSAVVVGDAPAAVGVAPLRRLRPEQVASALHGGALVLDVRDDHQRRRWGDIPGAITAAAAEVDDPARLARRLEEVDRDRRLVVVVSTRGERSQRVAARLRVPAPVEVADVAGGFVAWERAHLPTVPYRHGRVP